MKVRAVDLIQRAPDSEAAAVEDVGVDHGGFDIAVAEKVLNCAYVTHRVASLIAVFEQVGGEGMAEGMAADVLGDAGEAGGGFDGSLESGGVGVVAAAGARSGVRGEVGGGEGILPGPFGSRGGVFAVEGVGKIDRGEAGGEILLEEETDALEMFAEGRDQGLGEHRKAIFEALAVADMDLVHERIESLMRRRCTSIRRSPEP